MEKMKKDWEIYRDTGILGGYRPEQVSGMRKENKIKPVFQDASYWITDNGAELHREMLIDGRRFIIRSILSASEKAKTPTEQMLQIIDNDLKKESA